MENDLIKCPFCKLDKPNEQIKKRSYTVTAGNIGRVTSVMEMCDECFNKAMEMVK